MKFTEEQQTAVRTWVAEGASLSEVQTHLHDTFGIKPTFFDVRMLVMDLGAQIKDKEVQVNADDVTKAKLPPKPTTDGETPSAPEAPADGSVAVTVDTIQIPGAMISGSVVFSDGEKARWLFDQTGRFGFEPALPGYRPSEADSKAFQVQLQAELRAKGYC